MLFFLLRIFFCHICVSNYPIDLFFFSNYPKDFLEPCTNRKKKDNIGSAYGVTLLFMLFLVKP